MSLLRKVIVPLPFEEFSQGYIEEKKREFPTRFVWLSHSQAGAPNVYDFLPDTEAVRTVPTKGIPTFLGESTPFKRKGHRQGHFIHTLLSLMQELKPKTGKWVTQVAWPVGGPAQQPAPCLFPCCLQPLSLSFSWRVLEGQELLSIGKLRQEEGVHTNVQQASWSHCIGH